MIFLHFSCDVTSPRQTIKHFAIKFVMKVSILTRNRKIVQLGKP